MGQSMTLLSHWTQPHLWKEDEPDCVGPIKYDPEFGFGEGRKKKVIRATLEEMDSVNLEPRLRDFCAHLHIRFRGCVANEMPFIYRCRGYANEISHCYYQERIDDMKEYERERRLNVRERRLREASK